MKNGKKLIWILALFLLILIPFSFAQTLKESHSYIRANGKIVADNFNNGTTTQLYYYHYDALGNLVSITDQNGKVVESQRVEAFGNELQKTKSVDVTDRSFIGKEKDSNNLFYFGARYYDANTGRFISSDPLSGKQTSPQSQNKYTYAVNNPLKYVDLNGAETKENEEKPRASGLALKIYQYAKSKVGKGIEFAGGRGKVIYPTKFNKQILQKTATSELFGPGKEAFDCIGLAIMAISESTGIPLGKIPASHEGIAKVMEPYGWSTKEIEFITPDEQTIFEVNQIPAGSIITKMMKSNSGGWKPFHTFIGVGGLGDVLSAEQDEPFIYKTIDAGISRRENPWFVHETFKTFIPETKWIVTYPRSDISDTPELETRTTA